MSCKKNKRTKCCFVILISLLLIDFCDSSSICDKENCHCDEYGRVRCLCKYDHEEVVIRGQGEGAILSSARTIEVVNCSRVNFLPEAIVHLRQLRRINILNTDTLTLTENSLYWRFLPEETEMSVPGLEIGIHNTTILEIPSYAIKGRIDDIFINNTKIKNIRPYAFSNFIGLKRIEIRDSDITNIDTQAFKKFNLDLIHLESVKFKTIPSRMFSDVYLRTVFRIKNITANVVQSSSFIIHNAQGFSVEDSKINVLEGDAFRVSTTGSVLFKNNIMNTMNLGAFAGFSSSTLPSVYGPLDFILENTTLTSLTTGSLQLDLKSYNLIIKDLKVNQYCECSSKSVDKLSYYEMNLFCVTDNLHQPNTLYKAFSLYQKDDCYSYQLSTTAILLISAGIILSIVMILLLVYCLVRKGNKGFVWITKKKQKSLSDKEFPVILPDGRTYRETEVHVIVERAQLLTTDL